MTHPREHRATRRALALLAWVALSGFGTVLGENTPRVSFQYRAFDLEPAGEFRSLQRTALLIGAVEFLAVVEDPGRYRVSALSVLSDATLPDGRREQLCNSTTSAPARCTVDLDTGVGDDRLTFHARIVDAETGEPHSLEWRASALRTRAGSRRSPRTGGFVEQTAARSHPHDYVSRSVWVAKVEGKGDERRRAPILDLEFADFSASARGIGDIRVLAVRPPQPGRARAVPLVWNISSYLRLQNGRLRWTDEHAATVRRIRDGFRTAAQHGFDCDALVVEYASVGRPLFGPFRLHPGTNLTPERRAANRRELDALTAHLSRPPLQAWTRMATTATVTTWRTDFLSVYHTLNDLLRGYPGLKRLVLLTDGTDEALGSVTRFDRALWPERMQQLNAQWPAERLDALLHGLDTGTSVADARVAEFVQGLEPDDPDASDKIAMFLARVDPGGLSSLHPHRKDVWPPVDALIVPSANVETNRSRLLGFVPTLGGNLWSLRVLRDGAESRIEAQPAASEVSGELTFDEALLAVAARIRQSYVVELIVPNPRQDMQRHDLTIRADTGSNDRRLRLDYMAAYSSSPPQARKMRVYAAAPHKQLRLLAAYELRRHPFDDEAEELLNRRRQAESDAQVRAVLFESWISIQLQRLHVDEHDVRRGGRRRRYAESAYAELSALVPANYPNPVLAIDAKHAADSYRQAGALGSP